MKYRGNVMVAAGSLVVALRRLVVKQWPALLIGVMLPCGMVGCQSQPVKTSVSSDETPEVQVSAETIDVGSIAPDFEVQTLEGDVVRLADYRGKYVLMDFGASWCGPCRRESPNLVSVYEQFGSSPDFAMISMNVDHKPEDLAKYVESHQRKWVHGYLGDRQASKVYRDYQVPHIPTILLIGPDGRIIAMHLRGESIATAVQGALAR